MHVSTFIKKRPEEKLDLFEGLKDKGTSSPKCASMGSLLDQNRFKKCELEKMSNSSSEFIQQMQEDELAKDMGIFDGGKKSQSCNQSHGSVSSQGGKIKPLNLMQATASPVNGRPRRDSMDEVDLPENNLDVKRSSSYEMKNGRSSADKIIYHT